MAVKLSPFTRKLLFLAFLLTLTLFFSHRSLPSEWYDRQRTHISHTFSVGLNGQHANDEWGKQGAQTAELIEWGKQIKANPELDALQFLNAVLRTYPFLGGSLEHIGMPWTGWGSSDPVGIVVSVGSRNFRYACHLINNLRNVLHSKLPIAIAYAGDQDLKPKEREVIASQGDDISFIDLIKTFPMAEFDLTDSGWASKPFALLATHFAKTILVDADAVFLRSPDNMFTAYPELAKTGALFFHDRASFLVSGEKQDFIQRQFDSVNRTASEHLRKHSLFWSRGAYYEADSGVVAIDKSRPDTWLGLVFAAWMNTKGIRDALTHPIFYGDKESYWLAMELCGAPYAFPSYYAGSMGVAILNGNDGITPDTFKDGDKVEMCGKHMLHVDPSGQQPFWFNGGIYEDKDNPYSRYAVLTHWWMQPEKTLEKAPAWMWKSGNWACVTERGTHSISAHDQRVLEQIKDQARRIDAQFIQAGLMQ